MDVGDAGRHSDGGVFSNSAFGKALDTDTLCIPSPRSLPNMTQSPLPFVFVGDEAFPLKTNMLRPYPGKNLSEDLAIFNYRLSRARRIIENTFGILAARLFFLPFYCLFIHHFINYFRWRIFRRPIIGHPDRVVTYTKAAIALHNYLRVTESSTYCPPGFVDGEDGAGNVVHGSWRDDTVSNGLTCIGQVGGNR